MKRITMTVLVAAFSLALVAPVQAAPYLSKSRARAKASSVARNLYYDLDGASDYSIGSCYRLRSNVVDCEYTIWMDDDTIRCDDTVRLRLMSYGGPYQSFPYKSHCEYAD